MDLCVQRFRMTVVRLNERAQFCLMFKLVTSFSDKLCSWLELPAGKNSEMHPLFGKTIVFLVTSAEEVALTLYQKAQLDSAKYRFSIGEGQLSKLYRSGEGEPESLKETANTPNVLIKSQRRDFWIDVRSSNLVLGSGNETLLQWNDPSPIPVSYVSFAADPSENTLFLLFNRASKYDFRFSFLYFMQMHDVTNRPHCRLQSIEYELRTRDVEFWVV